MKFAPVNIELKNGERIAIREATTKDAAALIETVSRYLIDSKHLISVIEEFNPTIPQEKAWIQFYTETKNSLLLVATHQNKIIGNIDVRGEQRKKIRHNAILGIGMLKQWQNIGLGTALLQNAINWAMQNPTLKILSLSVHATNTTAIAVYKKVGFLQSGIIPGYVKEADGSFVDNITMYLKVK